MTRTLRTFCLSSALAVAFLSAGAFAKQTLPNPMAVNVTVIGKSSVWPLKGQITVVPCKLVRCRIA